MNEIITEAAFRKLIGKTAGHAYLLFGGEDYLKAHAVRSVREDVCPEPAFAVFNDITIDVADYTPEGLVNAMSAPPMMTEGKLILLRGLDFTAMRSEELDDLCEVLALLSEYDFNTVLIHVAAGLIDEGYAKKPSGVLKKLSEVAVPVRFEPATDAKLAAWAGKHFAHLGVQASPAVCQFLVSYVGPSMFVLAAEIEKLAYFALSHGRSTVGEEDVRLVAVPQLSADTFAMSNALLAGNFYASQGPEIYDLWMEDGKIHITCSNAQRIHMTTGRRKARVAFPAPGETCVNEAVFDVEPRDIYVRLTVIDHTGKPAQTNAYFTDELFAENE